MKQLEKQRSRRAAAPAAKSERPRTLRRALLAVGAVLLAAALATGYFLMHHAEITYVGRIPVVQDYLPADSAGRPGVKRKILYVVIHETDNYRAGADAKAHDLFIHENGRTHERSWHYTVDDHEIYHHLPDNEAAFHASDHLLKNGGNLNGIGVEMCVNSDGDYEKTLENTVQLTAFLLHKYGLTVRDVRKHQDFCGKICPARLIRTHRWQEFLHRVQQAYDADGADT